MEYKWKIEFMRSWCEYLTKCPWDQDIQVGSYECCHCEHCVNHREDEAPKKEATDMSKYFDRWFGEVKCSHPE